jgi:hypothetical protein
MEPMRKKKFAPWPKVETKAPRIVLRFRSCGEAFPPEKSVPGGSPPSPIEHEWGSGVSDFGPDSVPVESDRVKEAPWSVSKALKAFEVNEENFGIARTHHKDVVRTA